MEADREVALSELIDYLVSEPNKDSIVHAHTQNFGDIDLLLLATTEYQGATYYLFCELDNSIPVTDASGVMHLIILRGNGDRGLVMVTDEDELDKIADEFYCILLAETDVSFDSYNGYYYDIHCQSRSSSVNWHFPLISQCASSKNVIFSRFNSINFLIKCAFYVVRSVICIQKISTLKI